MVYNMPKFILTEKFVTVEVYEIEANDKKEALEKFLNEAMEPIMIEKLDGEIDSVTEVK